MMKDFLIQSFEWLVCLSEAVVTYLLYKSKFACEPHKKYIALAMLPVLATITFISNLLSLPWFALPLIVMPLDLVYAFIFFKGSASMKCIWSIVPAIIFSISNSVLLLVFYNKWGYAALIPGQVSRIIAQIMYVLLNFIMLVPLIRIRNSDGELPVLLRAITVVISLIGIAVAMYCFSELVSPESYDNSVLSWIQCFAILFLSISLLALSGYLSGLYRKHIQTEKELQITKLESEHISQVNAMYDYVRGFRHDIKDMLATVSKLIDNEETDSLKSYLNEINGAANEAELIISTGNPAIDATFSGKLILAGNEGIAVEHTIAIPESIGIEQMAACSIIMNLMDNAIEAVSLLPREERRFSFSMIDKGGMLAISIKNPCNGNYLYNEEKLATTKKDKSIHGIGLDRVSQIVSKHGGFLKIEPMQHSFEVNILLPLEDKR